MESGKIKVRLINRQNWSKHVLFSQCSRIFSAPLDAQVRKQGYVKTGLSKEEQTKLEKELALEKGTLNPNSEYWTTFSIKLNGEDRILDLSNPNDYLDYKILQVNKRFVADGIKESRTNPQSLFVLINEESEAIQKNTKRQDKADAYVKYSELTPIEMRKVLFLIGQKADNTSDEIVKEKVGDLIESDPTKFLKLFEDKDFETRVFLHQLKAYRILYVNRGQWYYNDTLLGIDEATTVEFVKNINNQELVILLKQALADKKNS